MSALTGVIFDHSSVLLTHKGRGPNELKALLESVSAAGLRTVIFTTHAQPVNEQLVALGYPPADVVLTQRDVGKRKGSPEWIYEAARRIGCEHHQLLCIGDDELMWRSAINAATIYIHSGWSAPQPEGVTALLAPTPTAARRFLNNYLLQPPRWEYSLDLKEESLYFRSLLGADVRLPASTPPSFTLQDVFTYNLRVKVGPLKAVDALMLHAMTSLYLEGLIQRNSLFAVYPSSKPGKISPILQEFLKPASKLFHGYFRDDLLVRAVQAVDSSMEKAAARKEGRPPNIPDTNQINTVHVNPAYRKTIKGRPVIVFDDFTTTGQSLEWARNLLYAAGAAQVILLTIGKYPRPHVVHRLNFLARISPFELGRYVYADLFDTYEIGLTRASEGRHAIVKSFEQLTSKQLPSAAEADT
jgi:hypothetical protein